MNIAQRIKHRRKELGLRIKDIAQVVDVPESTYREWENGRKIQGEPYIKMAEALDISLYELLGVGQVNDLDLVHELNLIESQIIKMRKNIRRLQDLRQ